MNETPEEVDGSKLPPVNGTGAATIPITLIFEEQR